MRTEGFFFAYLQWIIVITISCGFNFSGNRRHNSPVYRGSEARVYIGVYSPAAPLRKTGGCRYTPAYYFYIRCSEERRDWREAPQILSCICIANAPPATAVAAKRSLLQFLTQFSMR